MDSGSQFADVGPLNARRASRLPMKACHRDVGRGHRRRSSRANIGPNFKTHRRTVS